AARRLLRAFPLQSYQWLRDELRKSLGGQAITAERVAEVLRRRFGLGPEGTPVERRPGLEPDPDPRGKNALHPEEIAAIHAEVDRVLAGPLPLLVPENDDPGTRGASIFVLPPLRGRAPAWWTDRLRMVRAPCRTGETLWIGWDENEQPMERDEFSGAGYSGYLTVDKATRALLEQAILAHHAQKHEDETGYFTDTTSYPRRVQADRHLIGPDAWAKCFDRLPQE